MTTSTSNSRSSPILKTPADMDFTRNVYIHVSKIPDSPTSPGDPECASSDDAPPTDVDMEQLCSKLLSVQLNRKDEEAPKEKKRRRRRKLDLKTSLENYERRLRALPDLEVQLSELEGAYLSTFSIFSTESQVRRRHSNNAFVLMSLAREFGIGVKGVTSECKVGGEYRAPLLDGDSREDALLVYVGNYNYFTGHPESKWALKPCDKAYTGYC